MRFERLPSQQGALQGLQALGVEVRAVGVDDVSNQHQRFKGHIRADAGGNGKFAPVCGPEELRARTVGVALVHAQFVVQLRGEAAAKEVIHGARHGEVRVRRRERRTTHAQDGLLRARYVVEPDACLVDGPRARNRRAGRCRARPARSELREGPDCASFAHVTDDGQRCAGGLVVGRVERLQVVDRDRAELLDGAERRVVEDVVVGVGEARDDARCDGVRARGRERERLFDLVLQELKGFSVPARFGEHLLDESDGRIETAREREHFDFGLEIGCGDRHFSAQ